MKGHMESLAAEGKRADGRGINEFREVKIETGMINTCLLYTSPSPRDRQKSRMPSSA